MTNTQKDVDIRFAQAFAPPLWLGFTIDSRAEETENSALEQNRAGRLRIY